MTKTLLLALAAMTLPAAFPTTADAAALQDAIRADMPQLMALYREHGVNPIGSCLPLLFQLPVFMGLFFVLRGFSDDPPPGDLSFLGSFIPNIAVHVNDAGWAGWVLIVFYVASQLGSTLLMPTGADPQQQMMRRLFMVMPFIFVFFVIRFPVGLMIYWISNSITSSTRLYYETMKSGRFGPAMERVEQPTAGAIFPKEIYRAPRAWAEKAFNIQHWTKMPSGGHFAALEEPVRLVEDVRSFFRTLR